MIHVLVAQVRNIRDDMESNMQITIRKASIKDFKIIKKLAKEIDEEISIYYFKRLLRNICLVAEENKIVGVIYGEYNKKEKWTYLSGIVVLKEFRHKGIGKKLIKEFEKKKVGTIEVFAKEDTLARILPKFGYKSGHRYINFTK